MKINKEQLQAINSNSDRILCLAPAGSGKTHTLISRISRLVRDGVPPSSILALTFTNAAASEMKERYSRDNLGAEIPEFKTFHAFCYSILCKDPNIRAALGYESIPGIASEEQEKAIDEKARAQCKISLSKDQLLQRDSLTKKELFQAELYDKAVNRLMRSENIITFDKLNSEVAELFNSNNPATQIYKDKYKYITIDEYQDTDPYQMQFLNSFPNANFFIVGDTLQNLYSFRGTSNAYIKALSMAPDWEVIKLHTNYRSTNQICEYANKFSKKYADESYWIEMQGTRDGDKVITKLVEGPANYSAIDLKDIQDVLNEINKLTGTSAILCRTNKEVYAVTGYLKNQGISYTSNKDNQLQKIIDCALSDDYTLGLYASYLTSSKYGEYIRLSEQVKNPNLEWFLKKYGNNSQIKNIKEKVDDLKLIASRYDPVAVKLSEIEKLFHLQSIKVPDKNIREKEFLQYLKNAVTDIKSTELYIGTIHSVKGLEYDNVFVMNVGSYCFRLNSEDMKNLFYVAITRAKNRLYVYKLFD